MNIYNYSAITGEYICTTTARPDPLVKDRFLVPANATIEEPPVVAQYEVAVFEIDAWSVKEDHRGRTIYNTTDASPDEVTDIGPVPAGMTLDDPTAFYVPVWTGTAWENDVSAALAKRREEQKNLISEAFDAAPFAGLMSTLGYRVNATRIDKDNVRSLIDYCVSQNLTGFDAFRVYDNTYVTITLAELQQMHDEIVAFGLGLYQRQWAKEAAIDAAADEAAVLAITWESTE